MFLKTHQGFQNAPLMCWKIIHLLFSYTVFHYFLIDYLCFSCFFDGVNGGLAHFFLVTLPFSLILIVNTTLYVITWAKLRSIEKKLSPSFGKQSSGSKMKHAAVRAMSLFVLAFIFQWWAMALFGIWVFVNPGSVPPAIHHTVTTFSNVGGIVNLGVYLLIRKRMQYQRTASSDQSHSTKRSGLKETSHTDL